MLKHLLRGGGSGLDGNSWVATLGGSSDDVGNSVAVGQDGSVYVCGYTNDTGAGRYDFLLAKFNSSGALQWQKTLGGSNNDYCNSVAVGLDGSVYVCGYINGNSANTGSLDLLLAKFNASGTLQWQKTLGGSSSDYGNSVAVGQDGSVYVCGYTASAGAGRYDFLIAKFNSSGTLQWQKTLGGSSDDVGNSVAVGQDGSVYVCGYIASAGTRYHDLLIAKFNSSGALQWQKTLGWNLYVNVNALGIAVGPDGSVYVCGHTYYASMDCNYLVFTKFDSSGTLQWQKTLSVFSEGYSIAVGSDGSVYVCGVVSSADTGGGRFLITKFDSSGTLQWQKTLSGSDCGFGASVAVGPDGAVCVCGRTDNTFSNKFDLLVARITDDAIKQSSVVYGKFILRDASLTVSEASYNDKTSSLSVSNSSLSFSTSSFTLADANLTFTKYEGE